MLGKYPHGERMLDTDRNTIRLTAEAFIASHGPERAQQRASELAERYAGAGDQEWAAFWSQVGEHIRVLRSPGPAGA